MTILAGALGLVAALQTSPAAEATVFIRVVGRVRAETTQPWKESVEEREVELGTGSGLVISPYGHVLTNHHVVSGEEHLLQIEGREVEVKLETERVEVLFQSGARYVAAVDATSPDLDLALLSIGGIDHPYIPLGDSDAVLPGDPVEVLGYPFGRQVEVGRAMARDIVPQVTVSRGSMAALRASDEGDARYLQTDATVNPGSSGGPMLDQDGYAIGVIRMKLRRGSGVGYAIPINLAKDFVESAGIADLLGVWRLRSGGVQSFEGKGIRLPLPEGMEDRSPMRLRVQSEGSPREIRLTIDRIVTRMGLAELEQALVSGQGFEAFVPRSAPRSRRGASRVLSGSVAGTAAKGGAPLALEYGLLELGSEKVVARFLGPAAAVAYNRSVLWKSLEGLEADRLMTRELRASVAPLFEKAAVPPGLNLPARWVQDGTPPVACPGLPPPDSVASASPEGDVTVFARTAWWRSAPAAPEEAAARCLYGYWRGAPPPRPMGSGLSAQTVSSVQYSLATERWGVPYAIAGAFARIGEGLAQLEMEAPPGKLQLLRDVFLSWVESPVP